MQPYMPYIHTVYYSERFFTFFEPLYNYITLSCIVTYSHTCINIDFLYVVSVHISLHAFETLDTRANDAEMRAKKKYTRKKGEIREAQKEGGDENIRGGEKAFLFDIRPAVIQDERALICT